jgi:hypothetical protein
MSIAIWIFNFLKIINIKFFKITYSVETYLKLTARHVQHLNKKHKPL